MTKVFFVALFIIICLYLSGDIMKMIINTDIPFDEEILLTVNGETKTVDHTDENVQFELSDAGPYEVAFEHRQSEEINSLISWLKYAFIGLLIAILSLISESTPYNVKWSQKFTPYRIRGNFTVGSDMHVRFSVGRAKFNEESKTYSVPKVCVYCGSQPLPCRTEYVKNPYDFRSRFRKHMAALFGVLIIPTVLFTILLLKAISQSDAYQTLIYAFILAALFGTFLVYLIKGRITVRKHTEYLK